VRDASGWSGAVTSGPVPLRREIRLTVPVDVRTALRPLLRGSGDPTFRFEPDGTIRRATRTPDGPAMLRIQPGRSTVEVEAWGAGAERALAGIDALLGLEDDPLQLVPRDGLVRELVRRLPHVRLGRTGAVMEALLPAILEQKVTGTEAWRGYRGLVRTYGEPAPGPGGLRLQPEPDAVARLPYHAFHPLGVERRRADTVRRAAALAPRLEGTAATFAGGDPAAAYRVLRAIPGVGAWTAAEVGLRAFGDPDAVSVGDFHLKHLVSWAFAGEPRGTDERMLELLEPYAGQRGRVIRLLELSGISPPRYGPRMPVRRIEGL
jgi:3-methyladenine DNA glycosylase/8-oxoguanine DNA glycosylase